MSAIRRILAATDFSDPAMQAVRRAARLAAEQRAQLELLHVVSRSALDALCELLRVAPDAPEKLLDDVGQALSRLATDIANEAGIGVVSRVAVGRTVDEILAAGADVDLVVVGAHGLNPARDALLGTTAERLLGKGRQSILVVKHPADAAYRHALVAVDFSDYSVNALRVATQMAPSAHLTAVHAFEVPFEGQLWRAGVTGTDLENLRRQARQEALDAIHGLLQQKAAGRRTTHVVEHGNAVRLILDQEKALQTDVIAIGKHGRSATEEWLIGSVTRRIVADATGDVLVVQQRP